MTTIIQLNYLNKSKSLKIMLLMSTFLTSEWIITNTMNPNLSLIKNSWLILDNLSSPLTLLTLITTSLIFLSSMNLHKIKTLTITIATLLIMTFMLNNTIMFYITFELILIPTFLLITLSGKQPERLQASLYLLIYTFCASLPLLLGIIFLTPHNNFSTMSNMNNQLYLSFIFMLAFLVKFPTYMSHLWLPKAHVEAPLEGSMILAAVLLKLGGYGLIRFSPMTYKTMNNMSHWMISISLIGATLTSMNCMRQKDMKALIAYSSVSHMALIIASIYSLKSMNYPASMMMMMSHGLSSSALFLLVTMLYNQHHTRNTLAFKGLLTNHPNMTFWWFILLAINIAAPPTLNFLSEILIITSLIQWNLLSSMFLITSMMSTATFSFMLFASITHFNPKLFKATMTTPHKQSLSLSFHTLPLMMTFMKPSMLF